MGPRNLAGQFALKDATGFVAGLAALVRPCLSSAGEVLVAGIGSVVTRPDRRGQGLSSQLQRAVLERLAERGAALAVLWTDRPEIYAGRGFGPAGWEYHLDLGGLRVAESWPADADVVALGGGDAERLAGLYAQHPLRTLRQPEDHASLYGMPGTRAVGLERGGRLVAYACCGKGEDFPDYVAEWGGAPEPALALLAHVARCGLAGRALVPAGREDLLELATARGAGFAAVPSGLWAVLRPDLLAQLAGPVPADHEREPGAWLGRLAADGTPHPGCLQVSIWGLDSV
ncbi:MAG: GNAT family N-acetyltransferase [Candidatus Krumholzibacteriia bacterium]